MLGQPARHYLLLAAVVASANLFAAPAGASAPAPAVVGAARQLPPAVAFASKADGDTEIMIRQPDGSLSKLTSNRASDHSPAWSPDGDRVAFVSDRDGDDELFVMDADGSDVRQVTRNTVTPDGGPVVDTAPAWSPNGKRLVFASNITGGEPEIWSIGTRGEQPRRLTRTAPFVIDHEPSWSPDGRRIAFISNREGFHNVEIFSMRSDGGDVRRLTTTEEGSDDNSPDWSPGGSMLVFSSNRSGQHDLYMMRSDGTRTRKLTGVPTLDEVFPRWSGDGRTIVFSTFAGADGKPSDDVWTVRSSGTGRTPLLSGPASDMGGDPRPSRRR